MKHKLISLLVLFTTLPAFAQESKITITASAASQQEVFDILVTAAIPEAGLFPGWLDKDYYLIKTEAASFETLSGTVRYYFQVRKLQDKVIVDISGSYVIPSTGSTPMAIRNAGQRGSIFNKSWTEMENLANYIASYL